MRNFTEQKFVMETFLPETFMPEEFLPETYLQKNKISIILLCERGLKRYKYSHSIIRIFILIIIYLKIDILSN